MPWYHAQGPPNHKWLPCGGISHIPAIALSTSNAFNSLSLDDLEHSYHKHIKLLIKRTHHGTHISSLKCVTSLNILLLTSYRNFWETSVSKNPFYPNYMGKVQLFQELGLKASRCSDTWGPHWASSLWSPQVMRL